MRYAASSPPRSASASPDRRRRARARSVLVAAFIAAAAPSLVNAQSADAYFEFLMARRLEAQGDNDGALAALERDADHIRARPDALEIRITPRGLRRRVRRLC